MTELPRPPARDTEPIEHYAHALIGFVAGTGVTATMAREQLELAYRFMPDVLTMKVPVDTIARLVQVQSELRVALQPFHEADMLASVKAAMKPEPAKDDDKGAPIPRVPVIKPLTPIGSENLF